MSDLNGHAVLSDPLAVADQALAAAHRELEEAQQRLGRARGELADTRREVEHMADAVTGGGAEESRRRLAEASELATTQAEIVAAHERRIATVELRVQAAEAARATAEQEQHAAAIVDTRATILQLGEELDTAVLGLVQLSGQLQAAGRRMYELAGFGHGWVDQAALVNPRLLSKRLAALVAWRTAPPRGTQDDLGIGFADPETMTVLTARGLQGWEPLPAPAPVAAAPPTVSPDPGSVLAPVPVIRPFALRHPEPDGAGPGELH